MTRCLNVATDKKKVLKEFTTFILSTFFHHKICRLSIKSLAKVVVVGVTSLGKKKKEENKTKLKECWKDRQS